MLLYPVLVRQLLQLFQSAQYNEIEAVRADARLLQDEMDPWHSAAIFFLVLFGVGIPVVLLRCLLQNARPQVAKLDLSRADAEDALRHRTRALRRYGILHLKYEPGFWWFEIFEMVRRVILMAVMPFVRPGTTAQVVFGLLVSCFTMMVVLRCVGPVQSPAFVPEGSIKVAGVPLRQVGPV